MAERAYSIKLAGPINTRSSAINTTSAASGIVGIGIVGSMIVGASPQPSDKDRRYINCYTITAGEEKHLVKRPGFGVLNTPQSGSIGNQVHVWVGQGSGTKVISAFGGTNSSIYDGTTKLVTNAAPTTAITGKATGIVESDGGGTPILAISSSDSTGWTYINGGIVTKIADVDFPGNAGKTLAGTFAFIDGFAVIMATDATLHVSDLNSVTAWTAAAFETANQYPDKGVGCVRWRDKIMAFGQESVQIYYNAGSATGAPIKRVNGPAGTFRVGCVGAEAITKISDTVFWAGSSPEGGVTIYQYDGQPQRISTPEVDMQLLIAGAQNITMTANKEYGRAMVWVKAGSTTFRYCVEEKAWHEISSTTPLWTKMSSVSVGGTMVSYSISNIATTGKVYILNPASFTYQDDSAAYTARYQTAIEDHKTDDAKFYADQIISADVESSASPLTISFTDDDYVTYVVAGTVDLSKLNPKLTRLGASSSRAWVFTHSANTPMRLRRISGRLSIGTAQRRAA